MCIQELGHRNIEDDRLSILKGPVVNVLRVSVECLVAILVAHSMRHHYRCACVLTSLFGMEFAKRVWKELMERSQAYM